MSWRAGTFQVCLHPLLSLSFCFPLFPLRGRNLSVSLCSCLLTGWLHKVCVGFIVIKFSLPGQQVLRFCQMRTLSWDASWQVCTAAGQGGSLHWDHCWGRNLGKRSLDIGTIITGYLECCLGTYCQKKPRPESVEGYLWSTYYAQYEKNRGFSLCLL